MFNNLFDRRTKTQTNGRDDNEKKMNDGSVSEMSRKEEEKMMIDKEKKMRDEMNKKENWDACLLQMR